jgi:hypothetical protein
LRDGSDIVKHIFDVLRAQPELQLAHAWRIDQRPGAGQRNEFPSHRCVAAAGISHPYLGGRKMVFAKQTVGNRRLPDARGTQQGHRGARRDQPPERVEPLRIQRAGGQNRRVTRHRSGFCNPGFKVRA